MRNTTQYQNRGFRILSDAVGGFKPIDAICQFEYKDYQISISTAGLSKGACQTEVIVFTGPNRDIELGLFHTVQDAVEFIDAKVIVDALPDTSAAALRSIL